MFCKRSKVLSVASMMSILVLLIGSSAPHDVETILPASWAQICFFTQDSNILGLYVDQLPEERVFSIQCRVSPDDIWSLSTLQSWLKGFTGFLVFLTVECSEDAKISLPWPMKAKGLVGLKVSGCILQDKYADVLNPDISVLPDQLRVLEIRNSVWLSDVAAFDFMIRPEVLLSMSADYDCGQDSTLEYMVMSNVTDAVSSRSGASVREDHEMNFESVKTSSNQKGSHQSSEVIPTHETFAGDSAGTGNPDSSNNLNNLLMRLSQSQNISDALTTSLNKPTSSTANNMASPTQAGYQELLNNIQSVDHTCVYKRLKVLDESCPLVMSVHHFSIMVQSASYPELRTMNYSFSGLPEIPQELKEFRVFFPKLAYLDLSKNLIRHVNLPRPSLTSTPVSHHLSVDLRYNHITHINFSIVQSWATVKDIYVDVRFNPIDCGCHMNDLLLAMKSNEFFIDSMAPYEYLKEIRCYSPPSLKGKRLSGIELTCSSPTLNAPEAKHSDSNLSSTNLTVLFVFCGLAASTLIAVTLVAILYFKKYRLANAKGVVTVWISPKNNSSTDVENGQQTQSIS